MESNTSKSFIDLKVISGKHIRSFNYFQKLQLYVQVYITTSDDNNKKNKVDDDQKQRTATDMEGDANPEWNHSMRFDFNHHNQHQQQKDEDELFLQFDVRHHGNMFGDKTIGQVRIPFSDLIQDVTSSIRFVSYEIRSPPPDSKPNGVLSFSYKVVCGGAASDSMTAAVAAALPQISGYSIVEEHPSQIQYPPLSSGAENGLSSLMTPSAAAFPQISGYSIVEEHPSQIQYPPLSSGAENGLSSLMTPSAAAFPQISGYSIVEEPPPPPPPQIQYPPLSTENGLSSSPKIKYPTIDLDLDLDFKQDTWNNHHQPPYPPVQKPEQESDNSYDYYSRSESFNHHTPPPPPPPWLHGGHYPPHPPPPPPFGFHLWGPHPRPHPHPDAYGVGHNYHGPGAGWPNYWQQHEHNSFSSSSPHSPSWNGR